MKQMSKEEELEYLEELEKIRELMAYLEKREKKILQQFKGKAVLGFKLTECKSGKGNKSWRAYRCINGKRHVIYIGNDPIQAEEIVKKYMEKNGICS